MTKISLIVAVADNGVIGVNNTLPWKISADLKHFKRTTLDKPIIMGRLTYDSIGKALPGRTNIVMTRNPDWRVDDAIVVAELSQAIALASDNVRTTNEASAENEIMIIGGASIYREALTLADRIYMTRVHLHIEGDAFFPALDTTQWTETHLQDLEGEGQTPACTFVRLDRK